MHRHSPLWVMRVELPPPWALSLEWVGLGRLLSFAAALVRAGWRRNRRQKSLRILKGLDDRTLADLGFHRSEIPSIVMGLPGRRRR